MLAGARYACVPAVVKQGVPATARKAAPAACRSRCRRPPFTEHASGPLGPPAARSNALCARLAAQVWECLFRVTVVDAVVRLAGVGAKALVLIAARATPEERCRRRGQVRRRRAHSRVDWGRQILAPVAGSCRPCVRPSSTRQSWRRERVFLVTPSAAACCP